MVETAADRLDPTDVQAMRTDCTANIGFTDHLDFGPTVCTREEAANPVHGCEQWFVWRIGEQEQTARTIRQMSDQLIECRLRVVDQHIEARHHIEDAGNRINVAGQTGDTLRNACRSNPFGSCSSHLRRNVHRRHTEAVLRQYGVEHPRRAHSGCAGRARWR